MSFHCVFVLISCFPLMLALTGFPHTTFQNAVYGDSQHYNNSAKLLNETLAISMSRFSNNSHLIATNIDAKAEPDDIHNNRNRNLRRNRHSRSPQTIYPPSTALGHGPYSPNFNYRGEQFYNPVTFEIGNTLESPLLSTRPQSYQGGYHYEYSTTEVPEEATTEEGVTEETTTASEEATTTTLAPFTLADVKVPAPFLRIEYMICFTFFGIMYGLGFFVLFQSLCVPAAKIAVYIVYIFLLKSGVVDPVTLEQALEQLPPT